MTGKIHESIEAVKEFLDFAGSGDEYCLVRFDDWAQTVVRMTHDPERITMALNALYPAGWTALLDGISVGVKEVKLGHNSRKVIVLILDGGDNRSLLTQRQVRRLVREAGAQIYSIGMFSSDQSFVPAGTDGSKLLKSMSSESGGRFFRIHGTDELPSAIDKIMLAMRRQYLLGYYPRSVDRDVKYRSVVMKVSPPGGLPRCTLTGELAITRRASECRRRSVLAIVLVRTRDQTSEAMPGDLHDHPLYEGVTAERARLRELEAKFSRSIDNGSIDLTVIREYAAAVQSYTKAAMSWLSWVEIETLQAAKTDKTAGA